MPKIIEHSFIEEFKSRVTFTREELFEFFQHFQPELKEGTFGWRIHDLKNKHIIKPVGRGYYSLSPKPKFQPTISNEILNIGNIMTERFGEVNYCIWETSWLNEFLQHQSGKRLILIEVEKEFVESVFYNLKDAFQNDVYLNPDEKVIELYISESPMPVIVKKLITRAPVEKRNETSKLLSLPLLEKILVDIFTEEKLFYFIRGAELVHIFENAVKFYSINYTKLFSYARRREREQEIKAFFDSQMKYLNKEFVP